MTLKVGIDFGTSNSGVAVYDGRRVTVLPVDRQNVQPEVVKTVLYVTRDYQAYIGQEAVELWERVLAINPSYPLALFNQGYALLQLGRFHESRTASAKAMELKPDLFEAVNNLAICEICIGSSEKAIRILEASLKAKPDDVNSLVMLAVARLCSGEIQSGRGIFQQLNESGVEYAEFINEATKKLLEARKPDYARVLLETTILIGSGNDETGRLRGNIIS